METGRKMPLFTDFIPEGEFHVGSAAWAVPRAVWKCLLSPSLPLVFALELCWYENLLISVQQTVPFAHLGPSTPTPTFAVFFAKAVGGVSGRCGEATGARSILASPHFHRVTCESSSVPLLLWNGSWEAHERRERRLWYLTYLSRTVLCLLLDGMPGGGVRSNKGNEMRKEAPAARNGMGTPS